MNTPLMPKATAVWLLENTTLTFEQIAAFCQLHILEVQALADGEIPVIGVDPIASGQLTLEEIELSTADSSRPLQLHTTAIVQERRTGGPKYTPLNKRQDKPDAVAWLIRNHSDLTDNQIIKLVGTTKSTIEKIRNRTHWNINNIRPRSPVDLGICSQKDLDAILNKNKAKEEKPEKLKAIPKAKKEKAAKKATPKVQKKETKEKGTKKKVATKKKAAKTPTKPKAATVKSTTKKPAPKKATKKTPVSKKAVKKKAK